jgi:hypothetical protein
MAWETGYVAAYLLNRLKGGTIPGVRPADIYPDAAPPTRTTSGAPYVIVRRQGSTMNSPARINTMLFVVEVISGGDSAPTAGSPTLIGTAYNPFAVQGALDAIEGLLSGHRATITLGGAGTALLRIEPDGDIRYPDTSSGTRYNHQGRIWRVSVST